jgi:hypothetical protein
MPLSYRDVCSAAISLIFSTESEIARLGENAYIRLLRHAPSFAEHQFGTRKAAYERDNGDRIDNFTV